MKHIRFGGRGKYSKACNHRWNERRSNTSAISMKELAEYFVTYSKNMNMSEYIVFLKRSRVLTGSA